MKKSKELAKIIDIMISWLDYILQDACENFANICSNWLRFISILKDEIFAKMKFLELLILFFDASDMSFYKDLFGKDCEVEVKSYDSSRHHFLLLFLSLAHFPLFMLLNFFLLEYMLQLQIIVQF